MPRTALSQERAHETRRRILVAARAVFARRGYGEATVDDIAQEACLSMGALYHHFDSKAELFKALFHNLLSEARIELGVMRDATSLRDAVERFIGYWIEHLESDEDLSELFLEFWAQATRHDWAREALVAFFRETCQLLRDGLRVGQAAGFVRTDLDIESAALLLFASMQGVAVLRTIDHERVDLRSLMQPWVDLVDRFIEGDATRDTRELQRGFGALFGPPEEEAP